MCSSFQTKIAHNCYHHCDKNILFTIITNTTLGLQCAVDLKKKKKKINVEHKKPQKDVLCSYFLNYLAWQASGDRIWMSGLMTQLYFKCISKINGNSGYQLLRLVHLFKKKLMKKNPTVWPNCGNIWLAVKYLHVVLLWCMYGFTFFTLVLATWLVVSGRHFTLVFFYILPTTGLMQGWMI